jgi:hypothetical protein
MNSSLLEAAKKHVLKGGRCLTVVPGNGFSLSSATSCTYLHGRDGVVSSCLLETAPGEDIGDAADFLCQQVVLAQQPTKSLQEKGISGIQDGPLVVITYFDGLEERERLSIEAALSRLSRNFYHPGRLSDWPERLFV